MKSMLLDRPIQKMKRELALNHQKREISNGTLSCLVRLSCPKAAGFEQALIYTFSFSFSRSRSFII
jgi:hypothetical protein